MSDHDHDHEVPLIDPRIAAAAAEGCEQSKLMINRRVAMGLSAGFFTWAFNPRLGEATPTARRREKDRRVVIVILRGGMDGLNVAVPVTDPNYVSQRGTIAFDTTTLLTLSNDADFKLHKSLPNFQTLYNKGQASVVHAISSGLHIRSHFECQRNLENGQGPAGEQTTSGGWLYRALERMSSGSPVLRRGGALQIGPTPLILSPRNSNASASVPILTWSPTLWPQSASLGDDLLALYGAVDADLASKLLKGQQAAKDANPADSRLSNSPTALQRTFRGAAALMARPTGGARIGVINVEGWDTHAGQAVALAENLRDLDNAINDFSIIASKSDWLANEDGTVNKPYWNDTVMLIVTEFGRTVRPNSAFGTEHGTGTVALMVGGGVRSQPVVQPPSGFPGLAPRSQKDGRDLYPGLDLRQLFKGVLIDFLKMRESVVEDYVFPNSSSVRALSAKYGTSVVRI